MQTTKSVADVVRDVDNVKKNLSAIDALLAKLERDSELATTLITHTGDTSVVETLRETRSHLFDHRTMLESVLAGTVIQWPPAGTVVTG